MKLLIFSLHVALVTVHGFATSGDAWLPKISQKRLVIACNGYADSRSSLVGIRLAPAGGLAAREHRVAKDDHNISTLASNSVQFARRLHRLNEIDRRIRKRRVRRQHFRRLRRQRWLRRLGHQHLQLWQRSRHSDSELIADQGASLRGSRTGGAAATRRRQPATAAENAAKVEASALWTRPLAYSECVEFRMDLTRHQLLFFLPEVTDVCALDFDPFVDDDKATSWLDADLHEDQGNELGGIAVALAQQSAKSPRCGLRTAALRPRGAEHLETAMAAELAVLDAFAGHSSEDGNDALHNAEESAAAVVRLEDVVEPDRIASEEVASRTIGLAGDYAVEAKHLHVILEDIGGRIQFDRHDISFQANQTYLGIRLGRLGDAEFPERLLVHRCKTEQEAEDVEDV